MREVTATEFKAKCLRMLDELDEEGLVITKRGKAIAQVVPIRPDPRDYVGAIPDMIVDPDDDLLSTGIAWEAELPQDPEERARFIVARQRERRRR